MRPFPSVKLGTHTLPAAHVQTVRDPLNRQRRFPSQSRRQRQFVRINFGSLAQVGFLPSQFPQCRGDDRLRLRLAGLPPYPPGVKGVKP
jgi:hypothetical protein